MLLIYIPHTSSRLEYVFALVFNHELGIEYRITEDAVLFKSHLEEKINYSTSIIGNELFIKSTTLLSEDFIDKKELFVQVKHETKVLFPTDAFCDLGFDIFSAVFYMVSRYEEYLPFTGDEYGRFKAIDSIAFKNNFLQKPIVNSWIHILKTNIQKKFPSLEIKPSTFKAILTYDIDIAYKFKGRDFYRTLGSTAKDLVNFKWKNIFHRAQTLLNFKKDPWDVYEALSQLITKNKIPSIFFFLLADKTTNDRNLSHDSLSMNRLINEVKSFSKIGIHPSFTTSSFPEKIKVEKERLEKISGQTISKSRQHYLKFSLPETYNTILASGITEDYSMAFPEMPGFRAGTCNPFYFYDLKNEKATNLKIYPATCMEATFKYYSKISPEKSLMEILNLLKEVKKVEGTFISIWHNDNLGESKENKKWNSVHNRMVAQISSYLKNNNRK